MKGIYLAAYTAKHNNYNMDYNDIKQTAKHINIIGDMLKVDLSNYDYIIATPPCNYWSRASGNNKKSEYAIKTKHLLPDILKKLIELDKPFIVENVRSKSRFTKVGLYNLPVYISYRKTYILD